MNNSVQILTVTGSVLLRDASAEVRLLHCKKNSKERFIGQSAKDLDGGVTQGGSPSFSCSITGKSKEIGGGYVRQVYNIRSGEILKVFVKKNNGYGSIPIIGCMYLRPRTGAAYRVLKFNMFDFMNVAFKEGIVEGCFDVLTVEEAQADGVPTLPQYRGLFSQRNVNKIRSSENVVMPEVLKAVKKKVVELVNTDTGETTTVVRVRKKRAIDI